jgi:hypothetical protein
MSGLATKLHHFGRRYGGWGLGVGVGAGTQHISENIHNKKKSRHPGFTKFIRPKGVKHRSPNRAKPGG